MTGLDEVSNDYDQENDASYRRTISSSSFAALGTGLSLSQSIPENLEATEIEMGRQFKGLPLPQIILSTHCHPILRRNRSNVLKYSTLLLLLQTTASEELITVKPQSILSRQRDAVYQRMISLSTTLRNFEQDLKHYLVIRAEMILTNYYTRRVFTKTF